MIYRLVLCVIRPYCWKFVYEVKYPDSSASFNESSRATPNPLNEILDVEICYMICLYQG